MKRFESRYRIQSTLHVLAGLSMGGGWVCPNLMRLKKPSESDPHSHVHLGGSCVAIIVKTTILPGGRSGWLASALVARSLVHTCDIGSHMSSIT